jgi:hypothetical protein
MTMRVAFFFALEFFVVVLVPTAKAAGTKWEIDRPPCMIRISIWGEGKGTPNVWTEEGEDTSTVFISWRELPKMQRAVRKLAACMKR